MEHIKDWKPNIQSESSVSFTGLIPKTAHFIIHPYLYISIQTSSELKGDG